MFKEKLSSIKTGDMIMVDTIFKTKRKGEVIAKTDYLIVVKYLEYIDENHQRHLSYTESFTYFDAFIHIYKA